MLLRPVSQGAKCTGWRGGLGWWGVGEQGCEAGRGWPSPALLEARPLLAGQKPESQSPGLVSE